MGLRMFRSKNLPPFSRLNSRRLASKKRSWACSPRDQTQSRISELSDLHGVREVARRDKRTRFNALLHHVTTKLLRESYYSRKREAAPGVDGVTWREYETGLDEKLADLHRRIHRGTYRAQPSKRAYIPKADGRERRPGIAAPEDRVVQRAVVVVLNQIHAEDFLGFSYGFPPGRSQHHALDAADLYLARYLVRPLRGKFDWQAAQARNEV